MKDYSTEKIRNIALVGHGTTGKTTLADAMLLNMGKIKRVGDVGSGTTVMDHSEQEHHRGISINLGVGHGEWRDCEVNIIDTPGYDDFLGEVVAGMQAADGVVLSVSAVSGVEAGTERAFEMAQARKLPSVIVINMMDKENADFEKCVRTAQEYLHSRAVPLVLPIGSGPEFRGLVDLFKMKAHIYTGDGHAQEEDIPEDMVEASQAARDVLIEAVADFDDEVIEKYLEGKPLTDQEILSALKKAVAASGTFPIMVTSAQMNRGVRRVLDALVVTIPSPAECGAIEAQVGDETVEITADPKGPLAAQIFKVVVEPHMGEMFYVRVYSGTIEGGMEIYNVTHSHAEKAGQLFQIQGKDRNDVTSLKAGEIGALVKLKYTKSSDSLTTKAKPVVLPPIPYPDPTSVEAVIPVNKGDEDKIGAAIHKLMDEDPTIRLESDSELHQQLLHSMGELHLEVVAGKLREKHVEVEFKKPRIHFRETITRTAEGQGRYKKQTGGRGQFGDVWIKLEPKVHGGGFEFVNSIVGGVVPSKFIPAVEKGLREAMVHGILAGYPAVDMTATIYDGSHHQVDSSENAFKVAASMAFRRLMEEAGPVMLEPIMEVEIYTPEESTGDVMGDLSSRRGKILGMEPKGRGQSIKALVPRAELYRYSTKLRSFTQGRGRFSMKFHTYEEVPRDSKDRIIQEAKEAMEDHH